MLLGFVGLICWAVIAGRRMYRRTGRELEPIAEVLGGKVEREFLNGFSNRPVVRTSLDGFPVIFRFVDYRCSELDIRLPANYPLVLAVRRRAWKHHRLLGSQKLAAFDDDTYAVEAAPADVADVLLDAATRQLLDELSCCQLLTIPDPTGLYLRLTLPFRLTPASAAIAYALVEIAARVRDAYATAEAAIPLEREGSPHREMTCDRAREQAARARVGEVADLARLHRTREDSAQQRVLLMTGAIYILGFICIGIGHTYF